MPAERVRMAVSRCPTELIISVEVADAIISFNNGNYDSKKYLFPKVTDGLEGIRFIERSIASNASNSSWVNF